MTNVRAADEVQIRFKGRTDDATPREVTGEERDRYFEVMKQTWPNFSLYEKRTDRTIPVFVLSPATYPRASGRAPRELDGVPEEVAQRPSRRAEP